jgi:hypothetical protein
MRGKVSVLEVVDALELAADEMSGYVNRATGEVRALLYEELHLAEKHPDEGMPDWQQQLVREVRKVLASQDWLELPSTFDVHEWELMKSFGQSLSSPAHREAIMDSIHGSGAFRMFKSAIRRHGLEDAWFSFRRRVLEEMAKSWLEEHGLAVEEGSSEAASSAP